MIVWTLLATAAAVWPPAGGFHPEVFVRVEDPDHPDAVMRSETASLLLAPPTDGTPWVEDETAWPDSWTLDSDARLDADFADPVLREVLGVDAWHARGWRGQGVRVAVFDLQWDGTDVDPNALGVAGTADCWAHPSCETPMDLDRLRSSGERGVHGLGCAEIVRDVAPEAELYLVRVNTRTAFESAVDWAIRHDIHIVSMSMSFFNNSFYDGTGPFAVSTRRLHAAGILLVASAGNYATQHWSGPWHDGNGDRRLDGLGDDAIPLDLRPGARTVYVQWDEHGSCGASDFDAIVVAPGGRVVGRSLRVQQRGEDAPACSPVERVLVEAPVEGRYRLEIVARRQPAPFVEIDVLVPNGAIPGATPFASLADPASSPYAFVVGAVRADGYLRNDVERFSSWGPSRAGVVKPDVTGPNGLTVDGYGTRGFFGTSASAPAVAGAAAVVLSRWPERNPATIGTQLRAWAVNPGVVSPGDGRDARSGAGKVRLPGEGSRGLGCAGGGGADAALMPWWLIAVRRRRR